MSYADLLRAGVALANAQTKSLQAHVTHKPWIGQDGMGNTFYGSGIDRYALVDRTVKQMYTTGGRLIETMATLTILDPIDPTVAMSGEQRTNPVDPQDIFTLDDGASAPIVQISAFEDAGVLKPYLSVVTLGRPM